MVFENRRIKHTRQHGCALVDFTCLSLCIVVVVVASTYAAGIGLRGTLSDSSLAQALTGGGSSSSLAAESVTTIDPDNRTYRYQIAADISCVQAQDFSDR